MSGTMITGSVALVMLLSALMVAWRPLRHAWLARRRQRLISRYGTARLDNLVLEDGMGGHQVIEHLLLTPQGLLVLLPRQCAGALFGAERIDSWTQMSGGKSFHFENPLHQLEELLAVLRFHLPGIPVEGRVLFSGNCRFPKGRPERILLLDELVQPPQGSGQGVVPVLQDAWQQLSAQPRATGEREEKPFALRSLVAFVLFLGTLAWLLWRWQSGQLSL